eukprot:12163059-Ditylum_brightwellii.AAC.1
MKFESRLFAYLNAYKTYIDFDTFETEEEDSPGAAVEFEDDVTRDGGQGKEVLQELMEFVQKHYPDIDLDDLIVPKFKLQMGMRKFGNGIRQVEAPVIVIKCVSKGALYL